MKFLRKYMYNLIIYFSLVVVLALTIIASTPIERLLKLRPEIPSASTTSVHIVDVGQGSATLVHFASGENMLIDSGTPNSRDKLVTYINKVFMTDKSFRFDYVILTHSDSDHSGNMSYIINHYAVGTFYRPNIFSNMAGEEGVGYIDYDTQSYADTINALRQKDVNVVTSHAGLEIKNNGKVLLTMYSPEYEVFGNTNDYSPIMVLGDDNLKVCITGDASSDIERIALNNYDLPDVDVLVAGHHGSETSTCYEFLQEIKPERVVVSVGDNSYGHPSSGLYDTLLRYDEDFDKQTFSTKLLTIEKGNIIYYANQNSYKVITIFNVNDYLHVDYYVIVLCAYVVMLLIFVKPITFNASKNNK